MPSAVTAAEKLALAPAPTKEELKRKEAEFKQKTDAAGEGAKEKEEEASHGSADASDESDPLCLGLSSSSDEDADMLVSHDDDALFEPEDTLDYAHLADDYKDPLFVYPHSARPSPGLAAAYAARAAARTAYDAARRAREETERAAAERLGRLHCLRRESRAREAAATGALRRATLRTYEAELAETGDRCPFNAMLGRLRAYAKKHRGLPPPAEEGNEEEGDEGDAAPRGDADARALAAWVRDRQAEHARGELAAHRLAALAHVGVPFPVSEEDRWHRALRQFRQYAAEYWDNPILVEATDGDVLRAVAAAPPEGHDALQTWCREQREEYRRGALAAGRQDRLLDAGFTFDVVAADDEWDEVVEALLAFRRKFGHVRVPADYRPPATRPQDPVAPGAVAAQIRALVHRDALAPARLASLRRAANNDLYLDLGGRAYLHHVRHCKEGRRERGEAPRAKRKFVALALMAEKDDGRRERSARKKKVITRGSMANWNLKLEKLAEYVSKGGNITNIVTDVKLRGWTYSLIRKLSTNSSTLKGEKMTLIEVHPGLKECLLDPLHVAAAAEDHRRKKEEADSAAAGEAVGETAAEEGEEAEGDSGEGQGGEEEEDEEEEVKKDGELEDLAEDDLLGKMEDDELAAFMESE